MSVVGIIEFGMGNVQSVVNSCLRAGGEPVVVSDGDALRQLSAKRVILPGVGAVGAALGNFRARGFEDALRMKMAGGDVELLGICVGMQMLAEHCEEFGVHRGLGLVSGSVRRLAPVGNDLRLPHVGWNEVAVTRDDRLFAALGTEHFYFLHSYALDGAEEEAVAATFYGRPVTCAVRRGNVSGVQFHPEKSSTVGERLLANFLAC